MKRKVRINYVVGRIASGKSTFITQTIEANNMRSDIKIDSIRFKVSSKIKEFLKTSEDRDAIQSKSISLSKKEKEILNQSVAVSLILAMRHSILQSSDKDIYIYVDGIRDNALFKMIRTKLIEYSSFWHDTDQGIELSECFYEMRVPDELRVKRYYERELSKGVVLTMEEAIFQMYKADKKDDSIGFQLLIDYVEQNRTHWFQFGKINSLNY